MKSNIDFDDCIKSQEIRMLKIRLNFYLDEHEKIKLISECMNEIKRINEIKIAIAMRELRATKKNQWTLIKGYETLMASLVIAIMMCSCNTSYPVYAKNVHINDSSVVVDNGYWIHHRNYYEVNGKRYYWAKFKKTNNPDYISHR